MTLQVSDRRFDAGSAIAVPPSPGSPAGARARGWPLAATLGLALLLTGLVLTAFAATVSVWTGWTVLAALLIALTSAALALGAATAVAGLVFRPEPTLRPMPDWRPSTRTAILLTLCGEPPEGPARMLGDMGRDLEAAGLDRAVRLFVISDTRDDKAAAEEAALNPLIAAGRITYRRRAENTGRKPGNIADWLRRWGEDYDFMLTLDADSRMSADRIRGMIHRMERSPATGLLQAGMRLLPPETRFGHLQRSAQRLMGPTFLSGFAAWTGDAGNYYGHNAIIRVAAFRDAVPLPKLSGSAPLGGDVLSHDFVEAAWMRRAGWRIEIDAETRASAEDGPQTLAEFHKRDRRWCQGNLQHARLLTAPGLHPLSRLHMAVGIMGYLSAPLWLALLVLLASGAVPLATGWMLAAVAALLLAPKLCGAAQLMARTRGWRGKLVVLRTALLEALMSSLVAPLVMVHHVASVGAVLMGNDCGWKRPGGQRRTLPSGTPEALVGIGLLAVVGALNPAALPWLLPVTLPLLAAPWFIPFLEAPCTCIVAPS